MYDLRFTMYDVRHSIFYKLLIPFSQVNLLYSVDNVRLTWIRS